MIKNLVCNAEVSLLEVMEKIDKNGEGTALITNDSNKLLGVVTDGDVRRALIAGYQLNDPVKKILKKNFVYAFSEESSSALLKKISRKIRIIPIVKHDFQLVDYFKYSGDVHVPLISPYLWGHELKYLTDAFLSTWISSSGEYIPRFEESFARYCDCKFGVAVTSGTAALHLALLALGITKGDEVIIPDLTFAATANAVLYTGATPVIVDIEKDSWCIDSSEIKKVITRKTRAIIPVHLYGQPCDLEKIMEIAKKHRLAVIEDCAEAHGAKFKGKKVGSYGNIGCFSFYANKIITTGEGGMCITQSRELSEKMRIIRDHGMNKSKKYWHEVIGYNYRMTNLQAAIGVAQLEKIEQILKQRKKIENTYRKKLKTLPNIQLQKNELPLREKITWLVSALITKGDRDKYIERLKSAGIESRPFFYPLSVMKLYKKYVYSSNHSHEIAKRGINFPTMENLDQQYFFTLKKILGKKYT